MATGKELRLAVAMTGGVSLAVWMGGVAAELLQLATASQVPEQDLTDSQKAYRQWLRDTNFESAWLDVLVGTSAGGLNSALLGAAVARNVPSKSFVKKLRATWLSVGALQSLLRSPFESEPASLLRGDDYFKPQVDRILSDWYEDREDRSEHPDDPPPVHVIITCTLLDPVEVPYVDRDGRKIVEIDHRGLFEFDTDDLTKDSDAPGKLALAARWLPWRYRSSWDS